MAGTLLKPNPGDRVRVNIGKLSCTGIGTFVEYETLPSARGDVTLPVVDVTELDGKGYSYIWEGTIKKYGHARMIVGDKDILEIL